MFEAVRETNIEGKLIQPIEYELHYRLLETTERSALLVIENQMISNSGYIFDLLKDNVEERNLEDSAIVVFDLDYTWVHKDHRYQHIAAIGDVPTKTHIIIKNGVTSLGDLIKNLRSLQAGELLTSAQSTLPISLVIINNVSVFDWNMSYEGSLAEEYEALTSSLKKLQKELSCSVIVTAKDIGFTTGIVKPKPRRNARFTILKENTGAPSVFTSIFDHIIYLHTEGEDGLRGEYFASNGANIRIENGRLNR